LEKRSAFSNWSLLLILKLLLSKLSL
jgi:hypothetical protein